MAAYYNEFEPFAAAWLRELIKAGLIADGDVDERSIEVVQPEDVRGYTQCHFFAGIGGWSYALRLAGWPDSRPVWTGSCPCQPFAVAAGLADTGAQGQADARHLWPAFYRLISECRPDTVFGEQVSSAVQWGWWDDAAIDLENEAYASAAVVLRADGIGADHERKRLYWVADAGGTGWQGSKPHRSLSRRQSATHAILGDPFTLARRALAGDRGALFSSDGVSVSVARRVLHGAGNAIVPQVAQAFIESYLGANE